MISVLPRFAVDPQTRSPELAELARPPDPEACFILESDQTVRIRHGGLARFAVRRGSNLNPSSVRLSAGDESRRL